MKIVLDDGMSFEAERLETEPWLSYLYYTEHQGISMERVDVVEQLSGRETLSYVLRTLEILEEDFQKGELSEKERKIVKLALEWAEGSKGGIMHQGCSRESGRKWFIFSFARMD